MCKTDIQSDNSKPQAIYPIFPSHVLARRHALLKYCNGYPITVHGSSFKTLFPSLPPLLIAHRPASLCMVVLSISGWSLPSETLCLLIKRFILDHTWLVANATLTLRGSERVKGILACSSRYYTIFIYKIVSWDRCSLSSFWMEPLAQLNAHSKNALSSLQSHSLSFLKRMNAKFKSNININLNHCAKHILTWSSLLEIIGWMLFPRPFIVKSFLISNLNSFIESLFVCFPANMLLWA